MVVLGSPGRPGAGPGAACPRLVVKLRCGRGFSIPVLLGQPWPFGLFAPIHDDLFRTGPTARKNGVFGTFRRSRRSSGARKGHLAARVPSRLGWVRVCPPFRGGHPGPGAPGGTPGLAPTAEWQAGLSHGRGVLIGHQRAGLRVRVRCTLLQGGSPRPTGARCRTSGLAAENQPASPADWACHPTTWVRGAGSGGGSGCAPFRGVTPAHQGSVRHSWLRQPADRHQPDTATTGHVRQPSEYRQALLSTRFVCLDVRSAFVSRSRRHRRRPASPDQKTPQGSNECDWTKGKKIYT